jgi:hypothetical protein
VKATIRTLRRIAEATGMPWLSISGHSNPSAALDHYVSQVHLRNFYSPELGRKMYALRKSDLRAFPCRSEDVCRIEAGSTKIPHGLETATAEPQLQGVK